MVFEDGTCGSDKENTLAYVIIVDPYLLNTHLIY